MARRAAFFTHLGLLAAGAELVADDLTPVDLRRASPASIEAAMFQIEAIRDALAAIEDQLADAVAAGAAEDLPCARR
jgi:hypothetical protein